MRALAIYQAWAGSAGSLFKQSATNRSAVPVPIGSTCEETHDGHGL